MGRGVKFGSEQQQQASIRRDVMNGLEKIFCSVLWQSLKERQLFFAIEWHGTTDEQLCRQNFCFFDHSKLPLRERVLSAYLCVS